MFVVIAYDVDARRTEKYRKTLSRYLMAAQYSVFIGDITEVKYQQLSKSLHRLVKDQDRVMVVFTSNRRNIRVTHWTIEGDVEDVNHLGSALL